MNNTSSMKSEINLIYPNAGIRFIIAIKPAQETDNPEAREKTTLNIAAKDTSGERNLDFTEECSPILGDFIGGFVRWLVTLGVTAAHNEGEISGTFRPEYNAHKLIQLSGAISDMIEQRFSLYPESILS